MSCEESIVLKPKEPFADMILLENRDELAKFMEQPTTAIAEALTGAFASGLRGWMMSGGRLVQGMLKAKLFQVVSQEIKTLREKGKIPDDFADEKKHKYGFKSWVELFTIIDEEPPDADRLEALKAMFYSVNKINKSEGEKIVGYQLFQIAKKLTSGQVLYLKACYEIFKSGDFQASKTALAGEWFSKIGKKLGHQVRGLLDQDDLALVGYGLLTRRQWSDHSGITENDAHMSELGIKFCENIETYHADLESDTD